MRIAPLMNLDENDLFFLTNCQKRHLDEAQRKIL